MVAMGPVRFVGGLPTPDVSCCLNSWTPGQLQLLSESAMDPVFFFGGFGVFGGLTVSVVLAPKLKVASRVVTDWASHGRFVAFSHVTAVSAFPFDWCIPLEDMAIFYVCK